MDIRSIEQFIGSFVSPAFVFNASDNKMIWTNAAGKAFASVSDELSGKSFFETVCGFKRPCKACAYAAPYSPDSNSGMKRCGETALCSFADPYMTDITVDDTAAVLAVWPENPQDDLFVSGIDLDKGLVNFAGNIDSYYTVLKSYYNVGREKVKLIAKLYSDRTYPELRIEVHGIKGTSYVIGANELGDRAKELEYACRDYMEKNDEAAAKLIDDKVFGFLEDLSSFLDILALVCEQKTDTGEAVHLTDEEITSIIEAVIEKLDVYELEEAAELINRLKGSDIPEDKMKITYDALSAFNNYDYDKAAGLFRSLL